MSKHRVPNEQPKQSLVHQWTVAGIVSSAARFLPVPFVDDLVRSQCRRFVVSRTLAAHDQSEMLHQLSPYYSSGGGCLTGCVGAIAKAPLKLLLFPIRKVLAIVTSLRGVPLEIMETVLLGRTLDRMLRTDLNIKQSEALAMRRAFDETFTRMDFRVVRAALTDALRGVDQWKTSAIETAQRVARRDQAAGEEIRPDETLESGAEQVESVFARPETLELFAEFDRRFDEAFRLTSNQSDR